MPTSPIRDTSLFKTGRIVLHPQVGTEQAASLVARLNNITAAVRRLAEVNTLGGTTHPVRLADVTYLLDEARDVLQARAANGTPGSSHTATAFAETALIHFIHHRTNGFYSLAPAMRDGLRDLARRGHFALVDTGGRFPTQVQDEPLVRAADTEFTALLAGLEADN